MSEFAVLRALDCLPLSERSYIAALIVIHRLTDSGHDLYHMVDYIKGVGPELFLAPLCDVLNISSDDIMREMENALATQEAATDDD